MKTSLRFALVLAAVALMAAGSAAEAQQKLQIGGNVYTKFLWGTERVDGSLYNFTTIPSEGYGDTGQGTEIELLLSAKVSKWVEISGRLKGRFNQNFWTNFGGFGGGGVGDPGSGDCLGGDCGEFDSRSAQYLKVRGMTVLLTPGYSWVDTITIGSSDFGMFNPMVHGKIRFIDRDNGSGIIFQGSNADRSVTYDFTRFSLPRLWAGPEFDTGDFAALDSAYTLQLGISPSSSYDLTLIGTYVNDTEIDASDLNLDDGRDLRARFRNSVYGAVLNVYASNSVDLGLQYYHSESQTFSDFAPSSFFGLSGFSPVPAGKLSDDALIGDVGLNDPFGNGLSFNLQYFDIGSDYVSILAARREQDVLLTEGFDGAFAFPGPSNAAFGVFGGNPTRIGYGGWQGNAQQVATINVDNEFTDFDEQLAETVIGWKGFTFNPVYGSGSLDISAEYTYIDYNTNWQAFDDPTRPVDSSIYPVHELDTGVGHNFRSAYAPFQEKETEILALNFKYLLDAGKGVDIFGKVKFIDETDKRLDDSNFLPFAAGDCPGGGVACANNANAYNAAGNSTSAIYGNPPVITVNGVTGYQWKPFDSLADDDRDMDYKMYQLGAGYQLTNDLYASLQFERYDVDLQDGNTAFQAYQLHEIASGDHTKNKLILKARYVLGGAEIGFNYEYNEGTFDPDFGTGFVVNFADEGTAASVNVPVGSPGFFGRFGGWNSLAERDFDQQRFKAYVKVQF
ncbi:MAG: hypothetical protein AAGD01_18500 [Acidobacteriota bacterium]